MLKSNQIQNKADEKQTMPNEGLDDRVVHACMGNQRSLLEEVNLT